MRLNIFSYIYTSLCLLLFASCSTTSHLEEGEQLFIGLEKIDWQGHPQGHQSHFLDTKSEVEAALATQPNGALFGSSYYRTIFPYGLWIYNAWHHKNGAFAKWLTKSFGKPPVLMSNVGPTLRASVAKTVLQNNGFFFGDITYETKDYGKRDSSGMAKKQKILYHVNFGHLYTLDSISYTNYPKTIYDRIIYGDSFSPTKKNKNLSSLRSGAPFSVSSLDNERTRIYYLLRNHGYYDYKASYTSYLADTLITPGKVNLQVHLADSLPEDALRKWVIGKTNVTIRREMREQITDSAATRFLTLKYARKHKEDSIKPKPPIRPRIILADTKLRPGMLFSQDAYDESINALASKGIFSSIDISFKKRIKPDGTLHTIADSVGIRRGNDSLDTRAGAGVLDMYVTAVLDKPYDVTFEANGIGKTSGRVGPGVRVGLTKRNAFRGGESLNISAGANYEFQVGGGQHMGNSYNFDLSAELTFPRLLWPNFLTRTKNAQGEGNRRFRRRWYTTPATIISVSGETIRRAGFFRRNILSGEFTYLFQPTATSVHRLSPLILTYGRTTDITDDYMAKVRSSPTAIVALNDEMTPKIRYTYTYNSPASYRNPIYFQGTASEAGNLCDLGALIGGKKLNEKGKKLFGTPFSQFLKFEADIKKTWTIGGIDSHTSFVMHFYGGILTAYGNNSTAPFSELFYIGGANDLRGFTMRSIGPGEVHYDDRTYAYLNHNGDCKAVLNLEYRPQLFGSLYGAIFLDAGNVWSLRHSNREYYKKEGRGDPAKFDVAMDIGVGLRYDLDFFVIRLDWGYAVHTPYSKGLFKEKFHRAQVLNFAIGYPF